MSEVLTWILSKDMFHTLLQLALTLGSVETLQFLVGGMINPKILVLALYDKWDISLLRWGFSAVFDSMIFLLGFSSIIRRTLNCLMPEVLSLILCKDRSQPLLHVCSPSHLKSLIFKHVDDDVVPFTSISMEVIY
jgi:hypothetical protein